MFQETELTEGFVNGERVTKATRRTIKKGVINKPFFIIFCEDVGKLWGLTGGELKLLMKMASVMGHDNVVRVTGFDRREWAKEFGWSESAFNNTMSRMLTNKAGVIKRVGQGAYMIHPNVNKGPVTNFPEKLEKYETDFRVSYTKTRGGYRKEVKTIGVYGNGKRIDGEGNVFDDETGEVLES